MLQLIVELGIEGFETLSRGQQRQVLENLAQLTIGRIREDAVEGHDKDLSLEKAGASKFGSKFLGKVWVGMKDSFTKKFDIVNREKKLASEIEKGGMKEHEVVLKQMVNGMKTFGPAIKENAETGGLEIQFIETEGMSPGVAKVAEAYNEKGTEFSKIPYEWSLDTASKEQRESFVAAKEAYEVERGELLMHMKKAGGKDGDVKAIAAMAQTESVIEMQRFMQTAPDAAEELAKIENQTAWTQALKSVGTERGLYMAGGAIARTALGAMAGFVAAPAVAFASGAIRGWRRTGDELKKQDVEQRKGVAPAETAKTAETRALIAKINESITTTTDEHTRDQLKMDLYELNKSLRGTTKNMIESASKDDIAGDKEAESGDRRRGAAAKIGYLKAKVASLDEKLSAAVTDEERNELSEKKSQLMAQLSRRMNYTKQKISEGRVVFGTEAERIGNQYALSRSMAEAEVVLATEVAVDGNGDKAAERLARLLNSTDDQIKKARFNKKFVQAAKAGAIGGVFAELGAGAVDMFKWVNGGDSAIRGLIMGQETAGSALPEIVGATGAEGTLIRHPGLDAEGTLPQSAVVPSAEDAELAAMDTSGAGLAHEVETPAVETAHFPPMPSMDISEGVTPEWAETSTGLNVSPEDIASAEHDATWTEGPTGLRMTEEDAITAEMGSTSMEAMGTYAVQKGDTMTSILRGKFPGITDTQIENLRSQDLTKFGISSGNLDRIGLDDKLDMDKFAAAIKAGGGGGAAHAGMNMSAGAAIAGPGGGITETVEVFPNTALPPTVVGAEDAELAASDEDEFEQAHAIFAAQHTQAVASIPEPHEDVIVAPTPMPTAAVVAPQQWGYVTESSTGNPISAEEGARLEPLPPGRENPLPVQSPGRPWGFNPAVPGGPISAEEGGQYGPITSEAAAKTKSEIDRLRALADMTFVNNDPAGAAALRAQANTLEGQLGLKPAVTEQEVITARSTSAVPSGGIIRGSRVYSGSLPNADPRIDAIKEAAERLGRGANGSAAGNAATQLGNILGRRK